MTTVKFSSARWPIIKKRRNLKVLTQENSLMNCELGHDELESIITYFDVANVVMDISFQQFEFFGWSSAM